jgi:poly-gamma-glutamate synthesis protein (capsule biosynthesis protein)
MQNRIDWPGGHPVKILRAVASALALGAACSASAAQPPPPPIYFSDACTAGDRVTIAAVGDLLFHFNLQRQALAKGATFAGFWEPVGPIFRHADIVYGNLEGPAALAVTAGGREIKLPGKTDERAYDRRFYAGGENMVLVFNFHPSAVADVKAGGFTIVSTANNHAADRGSLGIDRTIDALEAANLAFTGTRRRGESTDARPWSTLTHAKGFAIAWLACTFSTNGMPDPHAQVLACFGPHGETRAEVLDEIHRLAAQPDVDAIILTPHWGVEYQSQPDAQQRRFAREAIEAGATAVIGSHPHVLEPWEKYTAADGREGLIVYSSGNFVSGQMRTEQRAGLISLLELTRVAGGKARLTAAGYVPTFVEFGAPWRVVENTGSESAAALALTMRLLPPANRMRASALDAPPKACAVATADAATTSAVTLPKPDAKTGARLESKPEPKPVIAGSLSPLAARPIRLTAATPLSHAARRTHVPAPSAPDVVDPHQ